MSDLTEKERIWNVVSRLALEALPVPSHEYCEEWASKLATRAAEQLATAVPGLSILDRVQLDALLGYLVEERERAYSECRSSDSKALRDWHAALVRLLGARP